MTPEYDLYMVCAKTAYAFEPQYRLIGFAFIVSGTKGDFVLEKHQEVSKLYKLVISNINAGKIHATNNWTMIPKNFLESAREANNLNQINNLLADFRALEFMTFNKLYKRYKFPDENYTHIQVIVCDTTGNSVTEV